MVCKYCGKESGASDICSECSEKIESFIKSSPQPGTDSNQSSGDSSQSNNQTNENGSQSYSSYVPKPKFFSFPRILAFAGVLLYMVCLMMPVYNVTLPDYAQPHDQALLDVSPYFLAIPVVMLFNIIFDRGKWIGLHFRVLRFKLLILYSIINMATLVMAPYMFIEMGYNISVNSFTGFFYVAIFACILSLAAPLFVTKKKDIGITPIKTIDLLWIIPAFIFLVILIARVFYLNSIGDYLGRLPEDHYNESYDDYLADSANDGYDSYEQNQENNQVSAYDSERDLYIEKLENVIDMVNKEHCVYDIDKDGTSDIIFRSADDDETLFYYDSDVTGTINVYDVYMYSKAEGDFVYSGQISTMNEELYVSDYNGFYGWYDNLIKALFVEEDGQSSFPISSYIENLYIMYKFDGSEIYIDDQNMVYQLNDVGGYIYGAGDEQISESSYNSAVSEIQAEPMVFEGPDSLGQTINPLFSP